LKTGVDGFSVLLGLLVGDGSHWSELNNERKGKKERGIMKSATHFYSFAPLEKIFATKPLYWA
jgi:hypothetical protein